MNTVNISLSTVGTDREERTCGVAFSMHSDDGTLEFINHWAEPKMLRQSATNKGLLMVLHTLDTFKAFFKDCDNKVKANISINYPEVVSIMNHGLESVILDRLFKEDEVYKAISTRIKELEKSNVYVKLYSGKDDLTKRLAVKAKVEYTKKYAKKERIDEYANGWAQ